MRQANGCSQYDYGTIVGIEYLMFGDIPVNCTERELITMHNMPMYKVAYIDHMTMVAQVKWFLQTEMKYAK